MPRGCSQSGPSNTDTGTGSVTTTTGQPASPPPSRASSPLYAVVGFSRWPISSASCFFPWCPSPIAHLALDNSFLASFAPPHILALCASTPSKSLTALTTGRPWNPQYRRYTALYPHQTPATWLEVRQSVSARLDIPPVHGQPGAASSSLDHAPNPTVLTTQPGAGRVCRNASRGHDGDPGERR